MRGADRLAFGCTMTFEAESGERVTLHASPGRRLELVRRACDYVVTLDPTFRMRSYSTPETILQDMTGARAPIDGLAVGGHRSYVRRTAHPEMQVLRRCGRLAMLHPALVR